MMKGRYKFQEIDLNDVDPYPDIIPALLNQQRLRHYAGIFQAGGSVEALVVSIKPDGRYCLIHGLNRFLTSMAGECYRAKAFVITRLNR
jgi:hypothetical protein